MSKRRNTDDGEYKKIVKKKRYTKEIKCLRDLINLTYDYNFYTNIDIEKLRNIRQELYELDGLQGMQSIKESVFNQILYYIQNLHTFSEDYLHTIISGSPGCGKCFQKSTPILMYSGETKAVETIMVGEQVMGDDSTPRTVLALGFGEDKLYRVTHETGDSYVVNSEHILCLKYENSKTIRENKNEFVLAWFDNESVKEVEERFSFTSETRNQVFDSVCKKFLDINQDIIEITVKDYLGLDRDSQNKLKGYITRVDFPEKYLDVDCRMLAQNINSLEEIPREYLANSYENRKLLLEAIADMYGSKISDNNYYIYLWKINCSLYDSISLLCNSMGLSCYYDHDRLRVINKEYHNIWVKYETTDEYYGFELDGNHRFVLGNFIVTHNTSLAKILGRLFSKLGILSNNNFVIARRDNFVAGYVGQTAIKTQKLLDSAKGGVLFIDEVYSFGSGDKPDAFAKEAVDTINLFMSENRHNFMLIVAGYEKDIESCFLSYNKGLSRRFMWRHSIEKYTHKELAEMFAEKTRVSLWRFAEGVDIDYIAKTISNNKELFENSGGDIENLFTLCKIEHSKRSITLDIADRRKLNQTDIKNALKKMKSSKTKEDKSDVISSMYI